jgi:2-polyprenyl-3-methyl-5-hydroxy-6-metoxy-1,4-benzoquinol methylase
MIIQRANMTSTLSSIGETVNLIASCLPDKHATILDMGCGEGIYGMILKSIFRKKIDIDGVDIEKGQFPIYDNFYQADMTDWEIPYTYDAILILHVLEHFPMDQAIALINKAKEACDCLIIGLPNSRKDHVYTGTGPHSHKWGIHNFPFNEVTLTKAGTKCHLYIWRK